MKITDASIANKIKRTNLGNLHILRKYFKNNYDAETCMKVLISHLKLLTSQNPKWTAFFELPRPTPSPTSLISITNSITNPHSLPLSPSLFPPQFPPTFSMTIFSSHVVIGLEVTGIKHVDLHRFHGPPRLQ